MDDAKKEKRRINSRNYRARNPDKVRTRNRNYREANHDKIIDMNKEYYISNRENLLQSKRIYVLNNKEKVANCKKESRRKARFQALVAYSKDQPLCECCRETDLDSLCIDHIDGGGNSHRRKIGKLAGYSFYIWLKKNKYPSGFRVLCLNCNDALGIFGYCPHNQPPLPPKTKSSRYFRKIKLLVLSHYSNKCLKCARCGIPEIEFLCLDHNGVDHPTKGRGGWLTYKWAINKGFPDGFQVLCFRCNFLKWKNNQ